MGDESVLRSIDYLVSYGIVTKLLPEEERIYSTNLILDLLHIDKYDGMFIDYSEEIENKIVNSPDTVLKNILDSLVLYAVKNNIVEDIVPLKDIFDSKLMNALMPRPKTVIDKFWKQYEVSPKQATADYFKFSKDSNYIRRDRIAKDEKWTGKTKYGNLQILVSLSKPELDPKAIAAAREAKASSYPKCSLCRENEGYAGRIDFSPRQNHRIIPLRLCNEDFSFQFSPYRYCNQHCIVLNNKHIPMEINERAIEKILEFVTMFPHYFLGSNADLPYVGGSVLSHEHFQGGVHRLPIMDANIDNVFYKSESLEVSSLLWPISTVKLKGRDKSEVARMANKFLRKWRDGYRDDEAEIDPGTFDNPHNTLAPLAYREDEDYVLFLMLRNNKRTDERPDGMFHTNPKRFHIKKEGIGIIDEPGLAILPPRLKVELNLIKEILLGKQTVEDNKQVEKHAEWIEEIKSKYKTFDEQSIDEVIQNEVVNVFMQMLEDCGVFKQTTSGKASFAKFFKFVLD